jgi:hypothetical protein
MKLPCYSALPPSNLQSPFPVGRREAGPLGSYGAEQSDVDSQGPKTGSPHHCHPGRSFSVIKLHPISRASPTRQRAGDRKSLALPRHAAAKMAKAMDRKLGGGSGGERCGSALIVWTSGGQPLAPRLLGTSFDTAHHPHQIGARGRSLRGAVGGDSPAPGRKRLQKLRARKLCRFWHARRNCCSQLCPSVSPRPPDSCLINSA